jgi:hypothetical protein
MAEGMAGCIRTLAEVAAQFPEDRNPLTERRQGQLRR